MFLKNPILWRKAHYKQLLYGRNQNVLQRSTYVPLGVHWTPPINLIMTLAEVHDTIVRAWVISVVLPTPTQRNIVLGIKFVHYLSLFRDAWWSDNPAWTEQQLNLDHVQLIVRCNWSEKSRNGLVTPNMTSGHCLSKFSPVCRPWNFLSGRWAAERSLIRVSTCISEAIFWIIASWSHFVYAVILPSRREIRRNISSRKVPMDWFELDLPRCTGRCDPCALVQTLSRNGWDHFQVDITTT